MRVNRSDAGTQIYFGDLEGSVAGTDLVSTCLPRVQIRFHRGCKYDIWGDCHRGQAGLEKGIVCGERRI